MSIADLIHWSGLALMVGAILLAVHYATHPRGESAEYVTSRLQVPSHALQFVAWVLILFGLVGAYARQSEQACQD